jgi:hypothetical protein
MLLLIDRTAVCAADSEHGCVAEQVVPVPDGEAKSVVTAARAGGASATATPAAAMHAAVAAANTNLRLAEDLEPNM